MAPNKGKGRRKIEIVRMEKKSNLHVTFSKRCSGLIKKANDLCTLAPTEMALIIFSPGNKPYSFGNPSVESIIHHYKTGTPRTQTLSTNERLDQLQRQSELHKLRHDLVVLQKEVEAEKERGVALDQMLKNYWWEASPDSLNLEQLEELKSALELIQREAINDLVQQEMQKNFYDHRIFSNHIVNSCGPAPDFANNDMGSGYGFGMSVENEGPFGFGTGAFQSIPDHQVQNGIRKNPSDQPILNNHMVNSCGEVPTFANNCMVSGNGVDPSAFGGSFEPIPPVESSSSDASVYLNMQGTAGFGSFGMN